MLLDEFGRAAEAPITADQSFAFGQSGYDGANYSPRRGQVWWPELDTRKDLDSFSRRELIRRSRWAVANFGVARGLVYNSAEIVGWSSPQAVTSDEEWNDLAEAVFTDRMSTEGVFDRAGKFDFWSAQPMLMSSSLLDGDILTVLTEGPGGGAQYGFYEAHQLVSPDSPQGTWMDGVKIDPRSGRHLAYGLAGEGGVVTVGARDAIYFGDFERSGHNRAVPKLAHALNHALDITETRADVKHGIKSSARIGTIIESAVNTPQGRQRQGLHQNLTTQKNSNKNKDGGGESITSEQVFEGALLAELAPGMSAKVLHDDRPHPNQMEFEKRLVRDMAVGFGLQPEVIYQMESLNGPGVRFVLDVAGRWFAKRQRAQQKWCRRVWVYTIAKEMKAGRLPVCKDKRWWQVDMIPQRDLTIDRGKEGKLELDNLEAGTETLADIYKRKGSDWERKVRQRVKEVKTIKDICAQTEGVEYEDIIRPRPGTAVQERANQTTPKTQD